MANIGAAWTHHPGFPPEHAGLQDLLLNVLDDAISYYSHVPVWYIDSIWRHPKGQVLMVPGLIVRRSVENLSAVRALVAAEQPGAIPTLLRALFELQISIRHLVTEQTEDRCAAYLVWRAFDDYHQQTRRLNALEGSDPTDGLLSDLWVAETREQREQIQADADQALSKTRHPLLVVARQEYERIVSSTRRRRHPTSWFQLFGGNSNLRELAETHGQLDLYLEVYSSWSRRAHGSELLDENVEWTQDTMSLVQLVRRNGLPEATALAVTLTDMAVRPLIHTSLSEQLDSYLEWMNGLFGEKVSIVWDYTGIGKHAR